MHDTPAASFLNAAPAHENEFDEEESDSDMYEDMPPLVAQDEYHGPDWRALSNQQPYIRMEEWARITYLHPNWRNQADQEDRTSPLLQHPLFQQTETQRLNARIARSHQ